MAFALAATAVVVLWQRISFGRARRPGDVIAGLVTPDAGRVEISGTDATDLPPQRRNVGFVFQHYAAFKHLTVAKNVAFGLEIRRRPRSEIRRRVRTDQ